MGKKTKLEMIEEVLKQPEAHQELTIKYLVEYYSWLEKQQRWRDNKTPEQKKKHKEYIYAMRKEKKEEKEYGIQSKKNK